MHLTRLLCGTAVVSAFLAGCGDNMPSDPDPVPDPQPITIGGSVSGLVGGGLVLHNNGGDELAVAADGTFVFTGKILPGKPYAVTIATQPAAPTQACEISNSEGVAPASAVTNVTVTCTTSTFAVGGVVSGLAGTGLALENNGTDRLVIAADGTFAFPASLASGSSFAITIATQPTNPTQTCTVSGGTGTLGAGAVTTVVVDCAVDRFTVAGEVSGLEGTVVLGNSNGDEITVESNGGFAFPTTIASSGTYAVTVVTQPATPNQTCLVSSGSGTVTDADISSVRVTCATNAFAIGGAVVGLAGTGLTLQNNAGDTLGVVGDGPFTFTTPVESGELYAVTIVGQPVAPSQVCAVASGSGAVTGAPITSVAITCVTSTFGIGGTVSGLVGSGLALRNNGGAGLAITGNGTFTFPAEVASGETFQVAIASQPTGPTQTCSVSGGTGTVGAGAVSSVTVNCAIDRFTIGGTISGLEGSVVLRNNGGDPVSVSSDGQFAFSAAVASGDTYAISVGAQPTSPSQTCTVADGAGTVTSSDIASVVVTCVTDRFTIGGTVAGLTGDGLTLRNNGGDALVIADDGSFAFATSVASGGAYAVTVHAQPTGPSQTCVVASGGGIVGGADISNVVITCTTDTFEIRGTVVGLAGTGLVLRNGADDLPVTTNGVFSFGAEVASGGSYAVSVLAQPSTRSQDCVVTGGAGPVTNADITSVVVTCTTRTFLVGGMVSGLVGDGLVLRNNGGDPLSIAADGGFWFAGRIASGDGFAVTIAAQPAGPTQTCVVSGGTGTIGGADAGSVTVDCTTDRFSVSGTISGLDGTVVLQNNAGDDVAVSSDGSFAFPATIASGGSYAVTVQTQPTSPSQTCVVTAGSGTVMNADIDTVIVTCTIDRFRVRGTLVGLANGTVTLRNNGTDDLALGTNGAFAFTTTVASGAAYAVTVQTQPSGAIVQTCDVTDGSGIVDDADVTTVVVTCTAIQFTVRANVTGLTTGTLVLQNNGADDLTFTGDGLAPFATTIASGAAYAVTVRNQPVGLTCTVASGSGTIGDADVAVAVTCVDHCFRFSNDATENLTNNNWFDACASAPGNTITVTLEDASANVVYQASGAKVGTWSPYDFLTSTAPGMYDQWDPATHDRIITLDNGDRLNVVGRYASNGGCGGSLGDGYGIVISSAGSYSTIRLTIQPYRQMNYDAGSPRLFGGWTPSSEISWNGGGLMDSCGSLTPFLGRFTVRVTQ